MDKLPYRAVDAGLVVFRATAGSLFGYRQCLKSGIPKTCEFNMPDGQIELLMSYRNKEFILEAVDQLSGKAARVFWIFAITEVDGDPDEEENFVRIRNGEFCLVVVFTNSNNSNPVADFKNVVEKARAILNAESVTSRATKLKMLSSSSRTSVSIPSTSEIAHIDDVEDSSKKVIEWLKKSASNIWITSSSLGMYASTVQVDKEYNQQIGSMHEAKMEQKEPEKRKKEIKKKKVTVGGVIQERVKVKEEIRVKENIEVKMFPVPTKPKPWNTAAAVVIQERLNVEEDRVLAIVAVKPKPTNTVAAVVNKERVDTKKEVRVQKPQPVVVPKPAGSTTARQNAQSEDSEEEKRQEAIQSHIDAFMRQWFSR